MQNFDYLSPHTAAEAADLLLQAGDDGRALAGGTDIIVRVREGRQKLKLLVDVKGIPELNEISYDSEKGLTLGAAVPCYRLCRDERMRRKYPGLLDAAGIVGGVQIQGRASVGGNLCNASPAADTIPALIVHDAVCLIQGTSGSRELPVNEFCIAPGRNALQPGELLIGLRLPAPQPGAGAQYLRFIPRNEMDIAVTGAAAWLQFDGRTVISARVALGAVSPTPLLVEAAATALIGRELSDETVHAAASAARDAASPITDMRGSVEQRKHLAAVMTRRAIEGAARRALS